MKEQMQGQADEFVGQGKELAGKANNDPELEGEGLAQQMQGKVRQVAGDMKDRVKGAIDDIKEAASKR